MQGLGLPETAAQYQTWLKPRGIKLNHVGTYNNSSIRKDANESDLII